MPAPRKAQAPADSSDRRELENVLRSAARFFQTNPPHLTRLFYRKKFPIEPYAAGERQSKVK